MDKRPSENDPEQDITKLVSGNAVYSISITTDNTDNSYQVILTTAVFLIFKNGSLLKNIATADYATGLLNIACCYQDGLIHVLVQNFLVSDSDNGLNYFTFDLSTLTITAGAKLTTGANEQLSVQNVIEYNGELYAAVTVGGLVSGGVLDNSNARKRVDVFKLSSGSWGKQSTAVAYNEVWGATFTDDAGVLRRTIAEAITPQRATLGIYDGDLYLTFVQAVGLGGYRNVIFTKKSTDGGLNWTAFNLDNYTRGYVSYPYESNGVLRMFTKRYTDRGYTFASCKTQVYAADGTVFKTLAEGYNGIETFCYHNGRLFLMWRDQVGTTYTVRYTVFTDDSINNSLFFLPKRNLGTARSNTIPVQSLQVGDYYTASETGDYANFLDYYILFSSSITNRVVNLRLGETVNIVWNGFGWQKQIISDLHKSRSDIPVFAASPRMNPFISMAFRIPVVTDTITGTLIATADARYCSGADYDEMDVAAARSTDGGRTWSDYRIIFKRPKGAGFRVHDCSLIVDRHRASAEYGRIWAFAKSWHANVNPANTVYWNAHPELTKFWSAYSDDDGLTWSAPTEETGLLAADAIRMSPGCSAGITLTDGTLIQPVYYAFSDGPKAAFIYKPPGGSWQIGDIAPIAGTNESAIIQKEDGTLIMNARAGDIRQIFQLNAIGMGWVQREDLQVLQDVNGGCCASFINYRGNYLFCQPTSYGSSTRSNITLFLSRDLIHWKKLIQLTAGAGAGYSCIVVNDSSFGVLYERDNTINIDYTDLQYLRPLL